MMTVMMMGFLSPTVLCSPTVAAAEVDTALMWRELEEHCAKGGRCCQLHVWSSMSVAESWELGYSPYAAAAAAAAAADADADPDAAGAAAAAAVPQVCASFPRGCAPTLPTRGAGPTSWIRR
eukprot:COSAG02_NODE_181_length_30783_cov_53.060520_6_plen_122_part_00